MKRDNVAIMTIFLLACFLAGSYSHSCYPVSKGLY